MKNYFLSGAAALAVCAGASAAIAQEQTQSANDVWTDIITVNGLRSQSEADQLKIEVGHLPIFSADTATLAERIPGGANTNSGVISGQIQYRGLAGKRINTRINGQSFTPGGPNLMDPPLHYAPMPLIDRLEVARSSGSVSKGPGIGGDVNAVLKAGKFGETEAFEAQTDLSAIYRSNNESVAVGGVGAIANQHLLLQALAAYEEGGDTRFSGGRIGSTSYERTVYGAGLGYRVKDGQEIMVEYRHQDTDGAGNPALPMDIKFFDSDFVQLTGNTEWGETQAKTHIGYAWIQHGMNNFENRRAPANPMQFREVRVNALSWDWGSEVSTPLANGRLSLGVDGQTDRHNVSIINPNNANFIVQNFNRYKENRYGGFVQWNGDIMPDTTVEAGVRYDNIRTNIDDANASFVFPPPVFILANAFNAADRKVVDHNFDAVVRGIHTLSEGVKLRAGFARKQRTPDYVERYAWLPISVSSGLTDGNNYLGDVNLKAEKSYAFDVGADVEVGSFYWRPSLYYRTVDNYIQGVPFDDTPGQINSPQEGVSNVNGDPTPLRFANVNAELYGFDADFGFTITESWRVDGVASYVRGKRRDTNDNLYRIAPPRLSATLTYQQNRWSAGVQTTAIADQNKVSAANSEPASNGAVIFNLLADVELNENVTVSAGLENVFNNFYIEHLAGVNRAGGGDVAIGDQLPASGRGIYVQLNFKR